MEAGGISNGSIKSILRSNLEVMKSWMSVCGFLAPYWIIVVKPMRKIFQFGRTYRK
jgi:hypothetical protein